MIKLIAGRLGSQYNSLSIKQKINMLFISSCVVLLILLTYFANVFSSNIMVHTLMEEQIEQNLTLISEKLNMLLEIAENYSRLVVSNRNIQLIMKDFNPDDNFSVYRTRVSIQSLLENIVQPDAFIDAMFVGSNEGVLFPSTDVVPLDIAADRPAGLVPFVRSSAWLDMRPNQYRKRGVPQSALTLSRVIIDSETGSQLGMLYTTVSEPYVAGLYSGIQLGRTGTITIVNRENIVVSSADASRIFGTVDSDLLARTLQSPSNSRTVRVEGEARLVVVKSFPKLDWLLVASVPVDEISNANKTLTIRLYMLGVVFILIAIVLSNFVSSRITNPIRSLMAMVRNVGEGDMEARADIVDKDEIGLLAKEFNVMVKKTGDLLERVYTEQKEKQEFSLALLQAQTNPHFLYNTLESICGLAELNRKQELIEMVQHLAGFYRGVLSKGSVIIPVKDEIRNLEHYLKIMQVRYGDSLHYRLDVQQEAYRCATINMLLQPIAENAIYHGLKNKRGEGWLEISCRCENNRLMFTVADNGVGMDPRLLEGIFADGDADYRRKSFGLKSMNERIKLHFGDEFGLQIDGVPGVGTTVRVWLPARNLEGESYAKGYDRG